MSQSAASFAAMMNEIAAADDDADCIFPGNLIDYSHLVQVGLDSNCATADVVASNVSQPSLPPHLRSRLRTIEQMLAEPPTRYIVRDLLPERGLGAIYGAPGAGKSFLAIDLAFAVASGRPHWFGRPLIQAPVAYVALEGNGGMQKRIKSCLAHQPDGAAARLRFFGGPMSLLDAADTEDLANEILQELGNGTVTIIDTLSRASSGGDENSSFDMTMIIKNAEMLGAVVSGPVIVVHHTGKDANKGLRGHSSLLAAVDMAIEVANASGLKSWTVKKNKDGEDGGVNAFELVSYCVGADQWGEISSLAVKPLLAGAKPPLPPVTGKNRLLVLAVVRQGVVVNPGGIGWDQALRLAVSVFPSTIGRRANVAKTTLDGLVASGHLLRSNDIVTLP